MLLGLLFLLFGPTIFPHSLSSRVHHTLQSHSSSVPTLLFRPAPRTKRAHTRVKGSAVISTRLGFFFFRTQQMVCDKNRTIRPRGLFLLVSCAPSFTEKRPYMKNKENIEIFGNNKLFLSCCLIFLDTVYPNEADNVNVNVLDFFLSKNNKYFLNVFRFTTIDRYR